MDEIITAKKCYKLPFALYADFFGAGFLIVLFLRTILTGLVLRSFSALKKKEEKTH